MGTKQRLVDRSEVESQAALVRAVGRTDTNQFSGWIMVFKRAPFGSGPVRLNSSGAFLLIGGLSAVLLTLSFYDMWGDVVIEGRHLVATLQENALPLLFALGLPLAVWWLSENEGPRYVVTAVRWTLIGCLATLLLGMIVGTIRLSQGHLKFLDIITQVVAFGAAFGILFGVVSAELKSARHEAQRERRRMESLKENVRDGIVMVESGGDVIDWNRGAQEIFGYRTEEILGQPIWRLVPDRHEEWFRREIAQLILADDWGASDTTAEFDGRRKDGSEFPLELSLSTWKTDDQRYFAAIIRDVSDRRTLQRSLLQAQEQERRSIGQELHDGVASQLTGARMMLDQAASRVENGESNRLQRIHDLVVESCEDIRRLSRGLNPTGLSKGDLPTALRELSENTSGCSFVAEGFDTGDGDPGHAFPDLEDDAAAHLYYISQEALSNARKYADAGEIILRLRQEADALVLEVEDDGIGFDTGSVEKDKSLGLRSMEHRAEVLGGTLTIKSAPGEGTLVRCQLPA